MSAAARSGTRPLAVVVDLDDTLYPQAAYLAGAAAAVAAAASAAGLDGPAVHASLSAQLAAAAAHTSPAGQARAATAPCPYGDGSAGARVAAVLADPATDRLLELTEPDFTDGRLPW